jgi:hypothetical protein
VGELSGTFIEHAAPEPVRLKGWTQGAVIAQETALLRPDRGTGS